MNYNVKKLLDIIDERKNGLYLMPLPTGFGKTHNICEAIAILAERLRNGENLGFKRILFITPQLKNLPTKRLQEAYGDDEAYSREVRAFKSNVDAVIDNIDILENLDDDFKKGVYNEFKTSIKEYRYLRDEKQDKTEYDKRQEAKLRDQILANQEKVFRQQVSRTLAESGYTSAKVDNAVRNIKMYSWIPTVYPEVLIDDFKVIFMSAHKLLQGQVPFGVKRRFFTKDFIEESLIFVDEFDSVKNAFSEVIRDQCMKRNMTDTMDMFKRIYDGLHSSKSFGNNMWECAPRNDDGDDDGAIDETTLDTDIQPVGEKKRKLCTLENITKLSDRIESVFHVKTNYRLRDEFITNNPIMVFYDEDTQTIAKENYVILELNEKENHVDISLGDKQAFYNRKEKISVDMLMARLDQFIRLFAYFIIIWAESYQKMIARERSTLADASLRSSFEMDNAVSSILKNFGFRDDQQEYLITEIRSRRRKLSAKNVGSENGYLRNGFTFHRFNHNDDHNDYTEISRTRMADTAESFLLFICQNATVIGSSATALIPTVTLNFNLEYIRQQLGEAFHVILDEDLEYREKVKAEYAARNKLIEYLPTGSFPSDPGKSYVSVVVKESFDGDMERILDGIYSRDAAEECRRVITGIVQQIPTDRTRNDQTFFVTRYCNIAAVMRQFAGDETQQGLLCLSMPLPRRNNPEFDIDVLTSLCNIACDDAGLPSQQRVHLECLNKDNLERRKKILDNEFRKGRRFFVMSSYQTVGAGQNLQFPRQDSASHYVFLNGTDNSKHTDYSSIYLMGVTHLVTNLNSPAYGEPEMITLFQQAEELYSADEISQRTLDSMIYRGFKSLPRRHPSYQNILFNTRSIQLKTTYYVLQGVGRADRTMVKNKRQYIYVDKSIVDDLDMPYLESTILSPAMETIVAQKRSLAPARRFADRMALVAEKRNGRAYRRISSLRFLEDGKFIEQNMEPWRELREVALRHPCASDKDREENVSIKEFWIECGKPFNEYLYQVKEDRYRDAIIGFEGETCFRERMAAEMVKDSQNASIIRANADRASLPVMLRFEGMRKFFEEEGYATEFKESRWMMPPVVYNNIYKGALGEVCGKFILESCIYGLQLDEIDDRAKFEKFDFVLHNNSRIFFDFKHWSEQTSIMLKEKEPEIRMKMAAVDAVRVIIVNIIQGSVDYGKFESADGMIVMVPCIINSDGNPVDEMIDKIRKSIQYD